MGFEEKVKIDLEEIVEKLKMKYEKILRDEKFFLEYETPNEEEDFIRGN